MWRHKQGRKCSNCSSNSSGFVATNTAGKYDISSKTPGFLATNTAVSVLMSEPKYDNLLPQTQLEMSWSLFKNVQMWCNKRGKKCPPNLTGFVATNTAGKYPDISSKIPGFLSCRLIQNMWFCDQKKGPDVSLKISGGFKLINAETQSWTAVSGLAVLSPSLHFTLKTNCDNTQKDKSAS